VVTSCGIFEYKNSDGSIRRELRLPEYVFSDESLATYKGKPVIITHHAGRVDKDNVDDKMVGTILSKGYQDGNDVRAKIIIHDIDKVKRSGVLGAIARIWPHDGRRTGHLERQALR
jgi:hypothetical protein